MPKFSIPCLHSKLGLRNENNLLATLIICAQGFEERGPLPLLGHAHLHLCREGVDSMKLHFGRKVFTIKFSPHKNG
jgi:hypothetical protein